MSWQRRILIVVVAGGLPAGIACSTGSTPADGSEKPSLLEEAGVTDAALASNDAVGEKMPQPGDVPESKEARALLDALRPRFTLAGPEGRRAKRFAGNAPRKLPLLRSGDTALVDGERLSPKVREPAVGTLRARSSFPKRAGAFVHLQDEKSGMRLQTRIRTTATSPAEVADGYLVHRDALGVGNHLLERPEETGFEDYVVFEKPPPTEVVEYDLQLAEGVSGLRLVGNALEALDVNGAPRLHVQPPWLLSEDGTITRAQLAVRNCAFDANPTAPWGRRPVPPGANTCVMTVSWHTEHYPALLDPTWSTTGSLLMPRTDHQMVPLSTGKVLVAGGWIGTAVASSELYDPATGTFAATGSTNIARSNFTATLLQGGTVLAAGGVSTVEDPCLSSAEMYDPTSGTWSLTTPMSTWRCYHVASALLDGRLLVAGGNDGTAEVFSPALGTWTNLGSMAADHNGGTASRLADGRVLIAGGLPNWTDLDAVSTAELFDPVTNTFQTTGPLAVARTDDMAVTLDNGNVLVTAGASAWNWDVDTVPYASTELYDPATGSFHAGPALRVPRILATATLVGSNRVLVAGGGGGEANDRNAEMYDALTNAWTSAGAMTYPRTLPKSARMSNGNVLIAGGYNYPLGYTAVAEVFDLAHYEDAGAGPGPDAGGVCGDGIRSTTLEECDIGVYNHANATCSPTCRVQDLLAGGAPSDAGGAVRTRYFGAGRHHVVAHPSQGITSAFVELNDGVPSVKMAFIAGYGQPSAMSSVPEFGSPPNVIAGSDPVVAVTGPGDIHYTALAFTDLDADGDLLGVALRRAKPSDAQMGPIVHVNTTTAFNQYDPDMIWTGSELVVAWADDSNLATGPDLKYRTFDAFLNPTSNEQTLSSATDPEADVVLTQFGTGWAAAYRSFGAGSETIHVRAGTTEWTVGPFLPGAGQQKPDLAQLDATHLLVAYTEGVDLRGGGVPKDALIRVAVLGTSSPGSTAPIDIFAADGVSRDQLSLAVGGATIWLGYRESATSGNALAEEIFARQLTWNGSSLGFADAAIPVARDLGHRAGDQRRPSLGIANLATSQALVAAWEDLGRTFGGTELTGDLVIENIPLPLLRHP
jgi:hypothetical protein